MWVFNQLNLFQLHEVAIKLLRMFASHLVFISLFLCSWFLNTLCIVCCFYLMNPPDVTDETSC